MEDRPLHPFSLVESLQRVARNCMVTPKFVATIQLTYDDEHESIFFLPLRCHGTSSENRPTCSFLLQISLTFICRVTNFLPWCYPGNSYEEPRHRFWPLQIVWRCWSDPQALRSVIRRASTLSRSSHPRCHSRHYTHQRGFDSIMLPSFTSIIVAPQDSCCLPFTHSFSPVL